VQSAPKLASLVWEELEEGGVGVGGSVCASPGGHETETQYVADSLSMETTLEWSSYTLVFSYWRHRRSALRFRFDASKLALACI
jgi:hypothetical protein